jgi:hypothetical protein
MNGDGHRLLLEAAAMHGELKRMLLALGITLAILVLIAMAQEFGTRKATVAIGWLGFGSIAALGLAAAALIWLGLV